jgi:hypothetical protein
MAYASQSLSLPSDRLRNADRQSTTRDVYDSPHARYRDRLTMLSTDALLAGAIRDAGSERGWWLDRAWSRMTARFTSEAAPFADFLFESSGPPQVICRVEAFDERPELEPIDSPCLSTTAGWLRVTRFPNDAGLPMLPSVLAEPGRATVVRYHPRQRCVIRFERNEGTLFAKIYPSDRGERVHRAGVALWHAASRGTLDLGVAEPVRWDPATRTLWQRKLEGSPIVGRLSEPDGPQLSRRIGRAAASLTRSGVHVDALLDGAAQMLRSERHGAELRNRVPRLAGPIAELLQGIVTVHAAAGAREARPIHGSPHPDQWLEDGPRIGVVDFDRLSLGDPELDAGTFLGDLDADDDLSRDAAAHLAVAFLEGYESVAGPLHRKLVVAYRAHQQLTKALNASRAVRPDGDSRAEKKLRRAMRCLWEGLS